LFLSYPQKGYIDSGKRILSQLTQLLPCLINRPNNALPPPASPPFSKKKSENGGQSSFLFEIPSR
jgi:hypothetical protein